MRPLNLDNRPCSPISSNCVIWQGPDIPCIKLCTGDTVSDIIASLGAELCTIMDQLKVSNYDLSCLNLTACPPEDFQALIQLLINKICELNSIPAGEEKAAGCPDCVVSVAPCFVEGNQTTMQLIDYVQMIANRICDILDQIDVINNQITNLDNRVTVLENTPPPTFTLPSIDTNCLADYMPIPGTTSAPIDQVLNTLLSNSTNGYCSLIEATGLPADLASAVISQCISSTDLSLKSEAEGDSPINTMGTEYFGSWVNTPTTVGDAITNLWISLCDLRTYVENLSLTVQDTNSVDLDFTSGVLTANIADTGWVDLLGFNHYAAGVGKPQCRRIGNQIHFRGVAVVPLESTASPGTVVSYTSTSYNSVPGCQVFTGGGGVLTNSNGSIQFNNGTSVIPASILNPYVSALNPGTNLDNTYGMGFIIGTRPIDLDATYGTTLTAALNVGITNDKKLFIAVLKDLEITNTRGDAGNLGTSHLRYITSNVVAGDQVPNFISASSTIHYGTSSGLLRTIALPAPLAPDTQFINILNTEYNTFSYPFNCDAGDEEQIGGFAVRLDGLTAYLDPCTTDIKPYIC